MRHLQFTFILFLLLAIKSIAEYKEISKKEILKEFWFYNQNKMPRLKKFTFSGEVIPYFIPEIRNCFYKELKKIAKPGLYSEHLLKLCEIYLPSIERILVKNGLPKDMKYIAVCESNLINKSISKQNAAGIWQLMKETAIELGLEVNEEVDERFNIEKSTLAVCKLLSKNRDFFGSWSEAAVAYNMGNVALYKAQKNQKTKDLYELSLNKETSEYIFRILAYKEFIENAPLYGQNYPTKNQPIAYDTIEITNSITNLKNFCDKRNWNYYTFKKDNEWILGNTLTIKNSNGRYKILVRKFR